MKKDKRICCYCEREVLREDMLFTKDCHGIPYRLVCPECYETLMADGYDGEYYTEEEECINEDW